MTKIILLLMAVCAGCSAYMSARRAGTWPWRLFALAMLGLLAIGLTGGIMGIWLNRRLGSDHALPATLAAVGFIVAGVIALTYWVRPDKKS